MNKHDFEKHPIAVGQVWEARDRSRVTITRKDISSMYPWDGDNGICYTGKGEEWPYEESDSDLVELIYDPNIVATPEKKEPCYNRKEILQAILDEKIILFRVDEDETWQEVKDNDWVLRMIADKTGYCFKVAPSSIIISDGKAYEGDLVWHRCSDGPYQVVLKKGGHSGDWENAIEFPEVYSIKEPEFEIKKIYKYMEDKCS